MRWPESLYPFFPKSAKNPKHCLIQWRKEKKEEKEKEEEKGMVERGLEPSIHGGDRENRKDSDEKASSQF